MIIRNGINSIDKDSCFIRLSNKQGYYLHVEKLNEKQARYVVKLGTVGAAIWRKESAELFIKESEYNNLEAVKVIDILGTDASMN